jgi:hypothetical protein
MLDPANIGTLFAIHDAELTMARLVLALAASRSDVGFPPSLEAVSPRFGGRVPLSPYDNAPIGYALRNGGNDVTITIAEATAESVTFPEITFNSAAR